MSATQTTNIETEAFVVDAPNAPFTLTPIILDEMRKDEYLIEMKYSGICHTVSAVPLYQPNRMPLTSNRNSSGKQTCSPVSPIHLPSSATRELESCAQLAPMSTTRASKSAILSCCPFTTAGLASAVPAAIQLLAKEAC
jgi:hypothetical protein